MLYRLMGSGHAVVLGRLAALRDQAGQGTVEYVALILLVSVVLAGVVAATKGFKETGEIGKSIVTEIKDAMKGVGGK